MSALSGARTNKRLYSPELLGLATELAHYPLTLDLAYRGEARSKTCGSAVAVALTQGGDGAIQTIGLQVSACAVGQAACAVFAKQASGCNGEDVANALKDIEAWLKGSGIMPQWLGIEALEPVVEHSSRHGAVILPWKAAVQALSMNKEPS